MIRAEYVRVPAEAQRYASRADAERDLPAGQIVAAVVPVAGFRPARDGGIVADRDANRWLQAYTDTRPDFRVTRNGDRFSIDLPAVLVPPDADLPAPDTLCCVQPDGRIAVVLGARPEYAPAGVQITTRILAPPTPGASWVDVPGRPWHVQRRVNPADVAWLQPVGDLVEAVRAEMALGTSSVSAIAKRLGRRKADVLEAVRRVKGEHV